MLSLKNIGGIIVLQQTNAEKTKENILFSIKKAVQEFDEKALKSLVTEGMQKGIDPLILANEGCIAAMKEMGDMFEADEVLLIQVLAASTAMKQGMDILAPEIEKMHIEIKHHDKAIITFQKKDEHSIKKSILEMMFMVNDFDVIELIENESVTDFIEKDNIFLNISNDCKKQINEVIHFHPEAKILQLCEGLDRVC